MPAFFGSVMPDYKIYQKSVNDLIPYVNNPRNNSGAVDAVASSIAEFGFKVPVVIDRNGILITGHTRLEAEKKLSITKIPAIRAADLTDAQVKAFRLADNKVAEIATWDDQALAAELQALDDMDFDMADFGFADDELGDNTDDIADPEIDLEKLAKQLAEDLGIAVITFSSASGMGITELKDLLWEELNKEQNQVIDISHSPIDIKVIERAEDEDMDEDDEPHTIYLNEVEEEWDLDKYRGIGWDTQE